MNIQVECASWRSYRRRGVCLRARSEAAEREPRRATRAARRRWSSRRAALSADWRSRRIKGRSARRSRLRGRACRPARNFDLVWRTVTARWKVADAEYHGREYTPVGYVIAKVKTDADGAFTAKFDAPDDFGF